MEKSQCFKTEYLDFTIYKKGEKTNIYDVKAKDGCPLGSISWYGRWRKYVFRPNMQTLFDTKCLHEIIKFIDDEMHRRKINKKA